MEGLLKNMDGGGPATGTPTNSFLTRYTKARKAERGAIEWEAVLFWMGSYISSFYE